jgi:extracellular factor (EF) 3-hydroxypalmitic acid methyl ester biosynthesis protein
MDNHAKSMTQKRLRSHEAVAPVATTEASETPSSRDQSGKPIDLSVSDIQRFLEDLARAGGPAESEYPHLQKVMDRISVLRVAGEITDHGNDRLWEAVGDASTTQTLMGFIYRKPHGYHGDFEIIDRFYTGWTSPSPHLARWDSWIQSLDATRAVRNRKQFFLSLLRSKQDDGRPLKVLNVGSGPCRDLVEGFEQFRGSLSVTCIELDDTAIEYARQLLGPHSANVQFVQKNVLRLDAVNEFDLAWSAGLFDYLEDRLFVAALKRMYRSVKPGGSVVIGNFSAINGSRSSMEWGNWRLLHRSHERLLELVALSGVACSTCDVTAEPLGVNLFITLVKA